MTPVTLDLPGSTNHSSNGKALNTRSHNVNKDNNKKKNFQKPNATAPGKTKPLKGNQCSYCNEHNHPYEAHRQNLCNRLKSARDTSASSAPPPAPARNVVPYRANLTVEEQYDPGVALIASSLPHPLPTIPSGSAFKTANDKTYEVWMFDTGASFHITADFSYLLEPIRCHVGLTVGGAVCLHATYMGSVQLHREISSSVLSVTLSDVSYVPDCNEACLIYRGKIDILGHFQMVGEDSFITVPRKSDDAPVFIAEVMHACYQVLPLARHNTIYTAATDFWQQALV